MAFFHSSSNIHHGQKHKNKRLHQRCKNHQYENGDGNKIRDKEKNNQKNDIFALNIAEQPESQRKRSWYMADNFNGQHKRYEPPNRSAKLFEVF